MTLTEADKLVFTRAVYEDPVKFCEKLLPNTFPGQMPWLHRGILSYQTGRTRFLLKYGDVSKIVRNFNPLFSAYINGEQTSTPALIDEAAEEGVLTLRVNRKRYCVMIIPRGSGKTSVVGIAVPLYKILFQECNFIVYVSETKDHAKMQLLNIRRELSANDMILEVFGDIKPEMKDDERWASDAFETISGMMVVARGRGSQIRGLNNMGNRPKLVICDDLEDLESVSTELQRDKTRKWAYGDLLPALKEIGDEVGELNALGTLLDDECLLNTFKNDPQFTCVQFGAYDRDGELLWDRWMDEQKLETKRQSYALAGQLRTFFLEYHSKSTPAELQLFRRDYFRYDEAQKTTIRAIYGDPAISKRKKADDAVICVVGTTDRGRFEVIDIWGKKGCGVREYVDMFFYMAKTFQCQRHGIESNGYQAALVELFQEEMLRKGYFFEPIPVTNLSKKTSRIAGILQPRFASGTINLRVARPKLESNLLGFDPRRDEQPDDYADALAGAIKLLDASAGFAAGEIVRKKAEPMGSAWRWAP